MPLALSAQSGTPVTISKANITLQEALAEIERQTNMPVAYNESQLAGKRVSVDVKEMPLEQVLKVVLAGTGFSYKLDKGYIMIVPEEKNDATPRRTVQGVVVDAAGEPLIGVNVVIKGTSSGAITDIDGHFSLQASEGDALEFSYVGYATQTLPVPADNRQLNITLEEDSRQLNEVVVTALGIKKEAKSLSYNVQQVSNNEITRVADANFVNNLAGKVAGVTINSTASGVGGSSRVVMRGAKSLNGNNNALYVVDGIPMFDMNASASQPSGVYEGFAQSGDPISSINPEDIESISVLSGPSAAALYGSAAANGVVMINTKKGKQGRTQVSISNNTSFSAPLILPEFQNTYGPSETGSFYSWGEKLSTPSCYDPADFFQTGVNVTNSFSLSTGTEHNQTYLSVGTTNANGVIHNNDYERYNATVRNISQLIGDKLTMDLSFMVSKIKESNMVSQGLYLNPLVPLYLFPPGDDFSKVQAYQRYDVERNLQTQYWPYADGLSLQNPYWITEHMRTPNHKNRYMATASFNYKVADWLNLTARAKIDRSNNTKERMYDAGTGMLFASKYGYYQKTNIEAQQVYGEFIANIDKYFGDDRMFNLTANIGANFEDESFNSDRFGGKLKSVANLFTFGNVDTSEKDLAKQEGYKIKKRAVFGNVQLGYRSVVYLDGSLRNDWSSTFEGTDTPSFLYGSIGLSGIITDIFKCGTDIMPYLKLRVSYSEVGNSPEQFIAIPTYALVDGVPATQTRRPNSNLKPERTKSWEAGLSAYFFKNKLKLDATFYTSRTLNQFFTRTLSATTGYTSEIINGGRVDNKGIELSLNFSDKWGDFGWNTYLTYSLNRNKVVELVRDYKDPYTGESVSLTKIDMGGTSMYKMILTEGGTIGDIYVNTLATDEHGAIFVHPVSQEVRPQPDIYMKAGNAAPKYNMGWGNTFTYKGISLSALFTARVGGIVVSQTQSVMDAYGTSKESALARDNGGAIINGRPIPAQPYYTAVGSSGGQGGIGSQYVYSATNVRLAELSLGYDVPIHKWVHWIKGLNVSFVGKNLFFIHNKAPFDPELTASSGTYYQGIDMFMSPSLRNLGFSVKIDF